MWVWKDERASYIKDSDFSFDFEIREKFPVPFLKCWASQDCIFFHPISPFWEGRKNILFLDKDTCSGFFFEYCIFSSVTYVLEKHPVCFILILVVPSCKILVNSFRNLFRDFFQNLIKDYLPNFSQKWHLRALLKIYQRFIPKFTPRISPVSDRY